MRICCIITIAYIMDLLLGDPLWLCKKISHPVILIGKLISFLEDKIRRVISNENPKALRVGGVLLVLIVLIVSGLSTYAVVQVANKVNLYIGMLLEAFICYQALAVRSLKNESMKVYTALNTGALEEGRKAVSYIVGRDTQELSEAGVIKATVETVAENTSDGAVAPLLYMFFWGAVGGIIYKAINTMDSMIGYKNEKYQYFGTCAARLDDVANYIPSRIAALLMIIAAYIGDFNGKKAVEIWRKDRRNHKSPNSAQTESVCAGALEIELAGDAVYFGILHKKATIGEARRVIEAEDIKRANRLLYITAFLMILIGVAVKGFLFFYR